MRWVAPRHEAAAAHMADGVFKTTGEIPVVMAGYGPGIANLDLPYDIYFGDRVNRN